jgi:hypothetical protein
MNRLASIVIGLSVTSYSFACAFSPHYSPKSVAALAKDAPYVIEATLAKPKSETSGHFKVNNWLKGIGPSEVEITGFGYGTDCRSPMYRERSILFLSKETNGTYTLRELDTYAGLQPPTKENIEAIQRALESGNP